MTDPGTGEADEARRELRAAAPEAVETVRELLDADDEQVRLQAAALVLGEYSGGEPSDRADGVITPDTERVSHPGRDEPSVSALAKRVDALEKAFQQMRQADR
jgi:hypothetical protein